MPSLHAFAIAYVWFLLLVRLGQSVYLLLAVDDDGTDRAASLIIIAITCAAIFGLLR